MKIINTLKENKKFNLEDLLNFCAKELNISDDVSITVTQNENLLEKLSKDVEYDALLCKMLPKQYVLYTKYKIVSQYVVCHEMIHMSQYERGDLHISPDFKKITWKGEIFDNSISYDEREWEKEAFSKQNKLWKNFKKTNKKKNV